jgi:hypothetical protein
MEALSSQLMLECLDKLLIAFPRTIGKAKDMAAVYREGLRGLSGDGVRYAVDRIIQDDSYFPKVARIREIARAWERVNRAAPPEQVNVDPLWCPSCKTRAEYRIRWRPKDTERGEPAVSADGMYLLLEPIVVGEQLSARLLCKCTPASPYWPIENLEPPAMLLAEAPPIIMRRAVKTPAVVSALEYATTP